MRIRAFAVATVAYLRVQPNAGSERIAHALAYALADAEVRRSICGCATSRALRDVSDVHDCMTVGLFGFSPTPALTPSPTPSPTPTPTPRCDDRSAHVRPLAWCVACRNLSASECFLQPDTGPHDLANLRANAYAKRHANA